MPILTYDSQLRTEITCCEKVIQRLQGVQSDTNALFQDDLRLMVSDCVDVAIQALQNRRSQMLSQLRASAA